MYVVDITREDNSTDMLVGNDSMSAKSKTINYVMDYVFANYNINLNKDVLDQNLNLDRFSLQQFLNDNYNLKIDNDLKIQSMPTSKDHCLFLKYMDANTDFPLLYSFDNKDIKKARALMTFLVNDSLINKYQDNLEEYDRLRIDYDHSKQLMGRYMPKENINTEIVSLYNGGMFLEELLNNHFSMRQLQEESMNKKI